MSQDISLRRPKTHCNRRRSWFDQLVLPGIPPATRLRTCNCPWSGLGPWRCLWTRACLRDGRHGGLGPAFTTRTWPGVTARGLLRFTPIAPLGVSRLASGIAPWRRAAIAFALLPALPPVSRLLGVAGLAGRIAPRRRAMAVVHRRRGLRLPGGRRRDRWPVRRAIRRTVVSLPIGISVAITVIGRISVAVVQIAVTGANADTGIAVSATVGANVVDRRAAMVVATRRTAAHVIVSGAASQRGSGEYSHQDRTEFHGFAPCEYIDGRSIGAMH